MGAGGGTWPPPAPSETGPCAERRRRRSRREAPLRTTGLDQSAWIHGRGAATRPRMSVLDDGVGPLFLIPALILLLLILVGPFFFMVWTSLTDLSYALPGRDGNFVGFDNFRRLMRDPIFWHSFTLTVVFV